MTDSFIDRATDAYVEKMNGVDESLDAWMTPKVDNMKEGKIKNTWKNYSNWANNKFKEKRIERWEASSAVILGVAASVVALCAQKTDEVVRIAQVYLKDIQQGLRSVVGGDAVWGQGTGYDVAMNLDPFFANSAEIVRNVSDVVATGACGAAAALGVATAATAGAWFFMHYKNKHNDVKNTPDTYVPSVLTDYVPKNEGVKFIRSGEGAEVLGPQKAELQAMGSEINDIITASDPFAIPTAESEKTGLSTTTQIAEPLQVLDNVPSEQTTTQSAPEAIVIDYIPDSSTITKESDKNLIQEVDDNFTKNVDLTERELMETVIQKASVMKSAKKAFEDAKANLKSFRMARDFEKNLGLASIFDGMERKTTEKPVPSFPKMNKKKTAEASPKANIANLARYKLLGKQREM